MNACEQTAMLMIKSMKNICKNGHSFDNFKVNERKSMQFFKIYIIFVAIARKKFNFQNS